MKKRLSLSQMMTRWNELAPEAMKLGLPVKIHTSPFESRAHGEKRLRWLEAEMKKAKRKRR